MTRPDFREMKNELYHYGTKGKSGRYPLGSGERPYQDYPGMRRNSKKSLGSTIKDKMYKHRRKVNNAILDKKRRDLNKLESRYEKSKDKKLDDKNKKRGKTTYDNHIQQMNTINIMNQQLQQQMQEQQQIMQQQQIINMMSHPFMF